MKVCHVTSVHELNDTRIFEKECSTLAEAGYETYLIGNGENYINNGVFIKGVKNCYKGRIGRSLLYSKKLVDEALKLNCDIYHLHDPELLIYGNKIRKKGHKVIFDSHEDTPRQILDKHWIPLFARKLISYLYEKYEKRICRRIDAVVVATEKIGDVFNSYGINATVIFNYPIENHMISSAVEKRSKNLLCFAGSLFIGNGIIQLIDVVCDLPNVRLKLAGPIQDEVKKHLELKKNDRIQYLGILSHQDVAKLYMESTIGVVADLPTGNNIDGLPIKMFEYMQFGLPILTTNFPLRKKMFEEYKCGVLIDPYNHLEYKKAVQSILLDEEFRKKCEFNGKIAVKNRYNWKSEANKLVCLYSELEKDSQKKRVVERMFEQ